MNKIAIIIGSTRPGRSGEKVAKWFHAQIKDANAEFEIVDLLDYNLPLLDEAMPPSMNNYQNDHTKKWSAKIAEFDGYIWVTPEYNHSTSAALKNAIDYLYVEWNKKTVGIVSYGSLGGVRAAEHLKQIAGEMQMHDIRNGVYVLAPWAAFDKNGDVKPENVLGDIAGFTDELIWWTDALTVAREETTRVSSDLRQTANV